MDDLFQQEVASALHCLREGGTILYPTDTIWGIGCDASNTEAVADIYRIKQRDDSKSLIILLADVVDIMQYVAAPDPGVYAFWEQADRPTTVIFDHALNLPENLFAEDGSIAIRIVNDPFCRHLIKRLQKPLVSTSANISGEPSPRNFNEISKDILASVTHIVGWRQHDATPSEPSRILRSHSNGTYTVIRE